MRKRNYKIIFIAMVGFVDLFFYGPRLKTCCKLQEFQQVNTLAAISALEACNANIKLIN